MIPIEDRTNGELNSPELRNIYGDTACFNERERRIGIARIRFSMMDRDRLMFEMLTRVYASMVGTLWTDIEYQALLAEAKSCLSREKYD